MTKRSKLVLTAATAALALAMAVGTASANRLSVDDQDFRIVWSPLTFSAVGVSDIECDVSLLGSFHSPSIDKVAKALIGHITSASVEQPSCEGGSATVLSETLPWHVTYEGFDGSLPNPDGVRLLLVGASFVISADLATCLARTTTTEPAVGIANVGGGGAVSSLTAEEGAVIDTNDTTGIFCDFAGVNGAFSGTGVAEDAAGNSIILTLI